MFEDFIKAFDNFEERHEDDTALGGIVLLLPIVMFVVLGLCVMLN